MLRLKLKTLFLATALVAVFVALILFLQERHPIKFRDAPDRSAGLSIATSHIGQMKIESHAEHHEGIPAWYATDTSPPISPKQAIETASAKLDDLRKQISCDKIELSSCNLTPWGPTSGHWYWLVEFHVWSGQSADTLRIHVLMDGSCGKTSVIEDDAG